MRSATDFLPCFMIEFMNLEITKSLNLGSGFTSRFSALCRRDMCDFLYQPVPFANDFPLSPQKQPSLGPLGSILGAPLLPVGDALRVEHAANNVIADAWKVFDAAASDHH